MEEITLCSPEHQEVFRRVWNRVMAGHPETGCPVEVTGDLDCKTLEVPVDTNLSQPQLPEDRRGSDLPMAGMDTSPDEGSSAHLRAQVLEALEGWQMYRHLARRTRNSAARTLTGLAADQHRMARKLAAAYFLLTGVRYWPTETLLTPSIPSLWGTLRRQHQAEQQAELSYRMAMDETTDPTLRELYRELTEGCRNHCRQLRALLEQSCT